MESLIFDETKFLDKGYYLCNGVFLSGKPFFKLRFTLGLLGYKLQLLSKREQLLLKCDQANFIVYSVDNRDILLDYSRINTILLDSNFTIMGCFSKGFFYPLTKVIISKKDSLLSFLGKILMTSCIAYKPFVLKSIVLKK